MFLRGQYSISGMVVDVNGKPVPHVIVWCSDKDQPYCEAATDTDGRFTIDGLFKGQVIVRAHSYRRNLSGFTHAEAGANNISILLNKKKRPPAKGRACFPSGTYVWVNGSLVQISKASIGQTVGKSGCTTSTSHFRQVEKIEEHEGIFECRDIVFENGNRISVVDSHCFMLDSGRWIAAQNLRNGLRLKTLNGAIGIKSVITRVMPFAGKVYNLKVKNSDRYLVGKDGVIVRDF